MNSANTDGILLFENSFVRIPYENYRHVFRRAQRLIERELGAVQSAVKATVTSSSLSPKEQLLAVDGMITKVQNLKRKLAELEDASGSQTLAVLRSRLSTLTNLSSESTYASDHAAFFDTRINRWLVDWALRTGRIETAKSIAQQQDIETQVDIELFMDISRIEGKLKDGSCSEALVWCAENRNALKKLNSRLEFDLRMQEYIEIARNHHRTNREETSSNTAISYYKKHLRPWCEIHVPETQQAMTLLVIPPSTKLKPYQRLYDPIRWSQLIQAFRSAIYNLNNLPSVPLLHLALYAGLASLKLPACGFHSSAPQRPAKPNLNCPVCMSLHSLASEVPFSHHMNSTIVCSITGKLIEGDQGEPLCFPNGNVYSSRAIESMVFESDGVRGVKLVKCPRTELVCNFDELRKVFIS